MLDASKISCYNSINKLIKTIIKFKERLKGGKYEERIHNRKKKRDKNIS